jgi:YVTN family beta-propeller protein
VTEFRILGPLEVREDGQLLDVGGGKQRALLAVLLLAAGDTVSTDGLIDSLWGENPPASAPNSLHAYVSRLRRVLGSDRLVRNRHGYQFVLDPDELDLDRFQSLLASGRELLAVGDAERAADTLRAALALWQGPPLADFTYEPFAAAEIAHLEDLRFAALEDRIEADIALGRHRQLVPELEALVRAHPLRERLRGQLMLALYRSGRQADALAAFRKGRSALADELGLEPGPALQELERQILTHDPALGTPEPAVQPVHPQRRRYATVLAVAGAVILALAAGAVVLEFARDGAGPASVSAGPNTVAVIDAATNRIVDAIPMGTHPVGIAYRGGDVWVANTEDRTVSRIDPESRAVKNIGIGAPPTDIVFARTDAIWTGNGSEGTLSEVSPVLRKVVRTTDLSGEGLVRNAVYALAYGAGSLWAATSTQELIRVDPRTGKVLRRIRLRANPRAVAYGARAVWAMTVDNYLLRIEPRTNAVSGRSLVGFTDGNSVAVGRDSVWVGAHPALGTSGIVSRLDPDTMQVESSIRVADPWAIAVGPGAVWVASYYDKRIYRIDLDADRVVSRISLGGAPAGIAIVDDEVWVTVEESEF